MQIADKAKLADDPYAFAIAKFVLRTLDCESRTVTFIFEDDSSLTFNIRYEAV